jgi:hypothetical protein
MYEWRKDMGKCEPIFAMPLLPYVERRRLEMLAPDRSAGIEAAQAYVDRKDRKRTVKIEATVILPIALIVVLLIVLALSAWAIR